MDSFMIFAIIFGLIWSRIRENKSNKEKINKKSSKIKIFKHKNYKVQTIFIRSATLVAEIFFWISQIIYGVASIWINAALGFIFFNLIMEIYKCVTGVNECNNLLNEIEDDNQKLVEVIVDRECPSQDRIWKELDISSSASV